MKMTKWVKDIFFTEEKETEETKPEEQKVQPAQTVLPKEAVTVESVSPSIELTKKAQPIYESLMLAISQKVPLFAQFTDMVKAFKGQVGDERLCYSMAFTAISKISSITKEELTAAIDDCVNALQSENDDFKAAASERNANVEDLRAKLQEKEALIARLTKESEDLRSKIDSDSKKNEETVLEFERAKQYVEFDLKSVKDKMLTFLQGGESK